jgi:hypothetical protein
MVQHLSSSRSHGSHGGHGGHVAPLKAFPLRVVQPKEETSKEEGDHKDLLCEVMVLFDECHIFLFIPVLGLAPQFIEIVLNSGPSVIIEGKVLVNSTPCAVQSTCDPTVDRNRIRTTPRGLSVNLRTRDRRW